MADALMESGADAVILMQQIGDSTALELLRRGLRVIEKLAALASLT